MTLPRQQRALLMALLLLGGLAWVVLVAQAADTDRAMMGLTMGMGAALFLSIWVLMMVAMMFPAAAPMIVLFHRIHSERRRKGQASVATWIFVGAYLVIWLGAGAMAYAAATAAESVAATEPELAMRGAQIGGLMVILAGLYQLSPLKRRCLAKCRSPLSFLLGSWREGAWGAARMGMEHGVYCLGCCWLLFALLFPLGVMNIAAMAVITALIFAEKNLPGGQRVAQAAAVVLVAYGAVVLAVPAALPTVMAPMASDAMMGEPSPAMPSDAMMREPPPAMPMDAMPGM